MSTASREQGFALVTALMMMAVLMALLVAYAVRTQVELSSTDASLSGLRGFYAAEAGLNIRAEQIRQTFRGYQRPAGTSPVDPAGVAPCLSGSMGTGHFACAGYGIQDRAVHTYVREDAGNPVAIVVPRGETYQNLSAQEYGYSVFSMALSPRSRTEAILEMRFKSRLVPLFQFAAFYNKDLEILPGPPMFLEGPVHSNGDLYLNAGNTLAIDGQVTTAGDLYHGRKNDTSCNGTVSVDDLGTMTAVPGCGAGGARVQIAQSDVTAWDGMIQTGLDPIIVPQPEDFDPAPGRLYWDRADIRVMLDVNLVVPTIQVRTTGNALDAATTATLAACGSATTSNSFFNNREAKTIRMLDVDVRDLLDCMHANALLGAGKGLDDATEGGLVVYLGVDGPNSAVVNGYGVRLTNGADLESTLALAPEIRGLTVVTDQAVYIQGNYNSVDKKPAAVMADSLNILSNNWTDAKSLLALNLRVPDDTTVQAAFLAGTDTTGGAEGAAGQDSGQYNGGLENYPRFHEEWSGRTFTYRGSFVSLNRPRHVNGAWSYGAPVYKAPDRDWRYDTMFNDAANLPPVTPRFVYLKQDLFVRQFEL